MNRVWQIRVIAVGLLLTFPGCAGNVKPKQSTDVEVKQLGIAYMKFLGQHRGKSPENKAELEKFIASMPEGDRAVFGVKAPAELFQSSRDGEQIVVRYGIAVPPPGKDPTVIAYEQVGLNGKRMVVYGTGGIDEITFERLKELVPDAK